MNADPTFFAKRRLSVYFRGARLMKDGKTDQRFWRLKWALTLHAADAHACGGAIESTYQHLQARENSAEKIELSGAVGGMVTQVFSVSADDAPAVLTMSRCFLNRFSMTWSEGMTEFWISLEHDLTDEIHTFVKNYAFQRFWVEFKPSQLSLSDVLSSGEAAARLQKLADEHGAAMKLEHRGETLAEFKPKRVQ